MKDQLKRLGVALVGIVIALGGIFVTAQPAQATEANKCLPKTGGALHGLCMFVEYYDLGSGQVQIRTVRVCVQVAGPADSAVARTHVKVYTNGSEIYDYTGEPMIYSNPINLATEKCTTHQTAATVSASDLEVRGSAFGSRVLSGSSAPDIFQSNEVSITNG